MSKQKVKVLVTGVFDMLHQEHINFLHKARELGDELVVGVESDVRVKQIKGIDRPIYSQEKRVMAIETLGIAEEVFVLPEQFSKPEDHIALIKSVMPDILAVSSHTAHLDKKEKIMKMVGGKVMVVHEHNPLVSTTQNLDLRKKRQKK